MKTEDYIFQYVNGDLSAFDKIYPSFVKDIDEVVRMELKKEISQILREEKSEYDIKKEKFYKNPLHWTNNKRKNCGLPVLRGRVNKHRIERFPSFRPTPKVFYMLENIIEKVITSENCEWFNQFVNIKEVAKNG